MLKTLISDRTSAFDSLNPFRDNERCTQLQDMYDTQDQEVFVKAAHNMYEGAATRPRRKPHGMSQSLSDNSMRYQNAQSNGFTQRAESAKPTETYPYLRFADENDPPLVPASPRGRALNRTPSPTKQLEDIKEESPVSPHVPPKRSRSPVKQLFGEKGWLGRSTSMKELPSEEYRKRGLKVWGGKLKQRMLEKVSHLHHVMQDTKNAQKCSDRGLVQDDTCGL